MSEESETELWLTLCTLRSDNWSEIANPLKSSSLDLASKFMLSFGISFGEDGSLSKRCFVISLLLLKTPISSFCSSLPRCYCILYLKMGDKFCYFSKENPRFLQLILKLLWLASCCFKVC